MAAGQNAASLAATAVNLPSGVTINDSAGNAANLSLAGLTQSGPQIDTTTPTITGISDSPATGDLNYGKTVALTLTFGENVTVAGGRPTLTLNDGGTAFYVSGSGTNALTFNYTVAAGQNVASLAATAVKPAERSHDQGQRRQRRQPVAGWPNPERAADRHRGANRDVAGRLSGEGRSEHGQDRRADAQLQ